MKKIAVASSLIILFSTTAAAQMPTVEESVAEEIMVNTDEEIKETEIRPSG